MILLFGIQRYSLMEIVIKYLLYIYKLQFQQDKYKYK
jgi:hypothetical protein